jgi:hypothetical protein
MKLENFKMSRDKWRPLKEELEKPGRVDWEQVEWLLHKSCGHCKEFKIREYYDDFGNWCYGCTLFKASLCVEEYCKEADYHILAEMLRECIPRNKRKARSIARRMYKQILKDDPREGR